MTDFDCNACGKGFDRGERSPIILGGCGHTFCKHCIQSSLQSTKSCPSCRMLVNVSNMTTNFKVLDLQEVRKNIFNTKQEFVVEYLMNLNRMQLDFTDLKMILKSELDKINLHKNLLDDCAKKLGVLIIANNPFDIPSLEEIKKLQNQFLVIRNNLIPSDSLMPSDLSMLAKNYESTEAYLNKIYEGVFSDKKFAAALRINNVTKYAKLSVRDSHIFIHAFEKDKKYEDLNTVCFKELLSHLLKNISKKEDLAASQGSQARGYNAYHGLNVVHDPNAKNIAAINGFLDLTYGSSGLCQRGIVEVFKSASNLGTQFLKLCTGEAGSCYKGCNYEQSQDIRSTNQGFYNQSTSIKNVIAVKNFGKGSEKLDAISSYFLLNNESVLSCEGDKCFLKFEADGSFAILKNAQWNSRISNVIGSVSSCCNTEGGHKFPLIFENAQQRTIIDCGIAVKM